MLIIKWLYAKCNNVTKIDVKKFGDRGYYALSLLYSIKPLKILRVMKNSPPIEKMIKFIKDNGLNNKLIANYLGITQSTFSDKINRIRYGKFTQLQVEKIWEYVQNLEKSISDLKKGE